MINRTRLILQMRGRSERIEKSGSNRGYEMQREVKGERDGEVPKAPALLKLLHTAMLRQLQIILPHIQSPIGPVGIY
jgi:hypothetical protein